MFELSAKAPCAEAIEGVVQTVQARLERLRKARWVAAAGALAGLILLEIFHYPLFRGSMWATAAALLSIGALSGICKGCTDEAGPTLASLALLVVIPVRLWFIDIDGLGSDPLAESLRLSMATAALIMLSAGTWMAGVFTSAWREGDENILQLMAPAADDEPGWDDALAACRLDPVCDLYRREVLNQGRALARIEIKRLVERAQQAIQQERAQQNTQARLAALERVRSAEPLCGKQA